MSKKPTIAESKHMGEVAELNCLITGRLAEIHHCGTYMGGGRDHMKVIPLCPMHHRTGGYGVAIHAGKKEFERIYGTEEEMLKTVELLLKEGEL